MGAASADEFSVAKCVDKVKLVAMGVGEFSSSLLTTQAKLSESKTYQSPRTSTTTDEPEPETPGGGSDNTDPGTGDTGGSGTDQGGGSGSGDGEDYYE